MKNTLFPIAVLALAIASAGCTEKKVRGPNASVTTDNNTPPVAEAGANQTVSAGSTVTLQGAGSDGDGSITGYTWSQASGPSVTLSTDSSGSASFTAPATEEAITLTFELRVNDDGGATSAADSVTVSVLPVLNKFFGTAVEHADDYNQLTTYFDQITPGNAGKWGSVESTRDVMDWTALNTAHTFATDNGLAFKYHTLFWGQQQPGWLEGLSVEEQQAEIDEWLEAVAALSPAPEMIDVVNEPLHAPPAYKEALGGDGETGWDWLITAFELARVHFPESKLILNDYNILNLAEATDEYLALVELLQSRDLIDGIGVQAHFLEQSVGSDVKDNLDKLATTGLPIYVSELDVNYADDARHANKLRELFTVFWEHPAVAGVTHWGYLQGHMWRSEAWLLASDGSERAGLQWLNCYLAAGEDCDVLVPEYIPGGWSGSDDLITLEAELYDEGRGVQSAGSVVAKTDVGDWILFQGVEFKESWDSFSVNYAKGSGDTGSLSIRLDSLDSGNTLRVELPPTNGWSEYTTASADWAPISGSRDVYVRFNDVRGVGNIDWLRFGVAGAEPVNNLVSNGDFEQGADGWSAGWAGGALSTSGDKSQSGSRSLLASGFGGGAYALYNLTAGVEAGGSYPVSAWVNLSAAGRVTITRKLACAGQSDSYGWLVDKSDIPADTWTELQATLEIPATCEPTEVLMYFENTTAGTDVYIDNVQVIAPGAGEEVDPNLVNDGGFEGSSLSGNWSAWWSGGTSLAVSNEQAQAGSQSLKVSARAANSMPSYNLTAAVVPGTTYDVSVWVHHSGPDAAPVGLTRKLACDGMDDSYSGIASAESVAANSWTELTGTLEVPADCTVTELRAYFEGIPDTVETLYIDEFSVTPQ
ncbi:endo-1,4-beta-xylanase [Microbulbifer bruguierae]|uniref:endo-1,4-beta-xylanase n=1 Tax=Microbulbifer bruguierae TaxID=3029061 RepID=A0ABY8NHF9_9GAMM|nr:endo-1,4-beta-xylanase [Microbulbifer bruguierae]WGL18361.1 endo-1,4-beta-xylanase [Microbulbifer bruguierae]